ncbi:hypothetical protein QAD02_018538 [Eretmocerus hayati]|uniref:Uncharacterized protein n=1 Tax=Eretmocerus hayati TaxID=131215 RepID=A0ACC2PH21_9HYME|nr:hypothetical protein QAD02_018538 [Eretmocerus hayati]
MRSRKSETIVPPYTQFALYRAVPSNAPALSRAENKLVAMSPDDEDGFVVTTKGFKRPKLEQRTEIPLRNSFAPIAATRLEAMEIANNSGEHGTDTTPSKPPRYRNIPPTQIYQIKFNHRKISAILPKFCKEMPDLKYADKEECVYTYTKTREDYETLIEYLRKKDHKFVSYTPSWNKTKRLVLKGLPDLPEENTKSELTKRGIERESISLIKKRSAPMPSCPVRLLTFPMQTDLKDLCRIKQLCYTKVTWEPYRNRKGISQCHRCQLYGHEATTCNLPPKCVKCSDNHLTKDCKKEENQPPLCANCGGAHPASYSQCPITVQYKIRNTKQTNRHETRRTSPPKTADVKEYPPKRKFRSSSGAV